MGRIKRNFLIEGASGKVGKMLLKTRGRKTFISAMPDRSKVVLSPKQKAANERFAQAVAYAQEVLKDPEKCKAYEQNSKSESSVYHLALKDFLAKLKNSQSDT